jgi:hypothetical protein
MTSEHVIALVVDTLDEEGVPYVLTGSLASSLHGISRATQDADFLVQVSPGDMNRIRSRLAKHFRVEDQARFETVTGKAMHVFRHMAPAFTVELFEATDDPHDVARLSRRISVSFADRSVWFATPEDVIITKLNWYQRARRSKDIDDVRGVLAVQGIDALDIVYLRSWCDRHGTRDLLEKLIVELDQQSGE